MTNNNPWLALSTYEEQDEYRFKGREHDTSKILTMLQQEEYITIYAASGDGKSSLINAGLCPQMRKLGYFPINITLPENVDEFTLDDGTIDFDNLILNQINNSLINYENKLLSKYGKEYCNVSFEKKSEYIYNPLLDKKLWWKLRTEYIQLPYGEFDYVPVLIFDQFEEIFRTSYKRQFFKWLEILSKDICCDDVYSLAQEIGCIVPTHKRFKIIFSMRYEYVGELDYHCSQRCFIPQMMRGRYFLKPLNKEQALSVILSQSSGNQTALKTISSNADAILSELSKCNENDSDEVSAILLSIMCYVYYEQIVNEHIQSLPSSQDLVSAYYKSILLKLKIFDECQDDIEGHLLTKDGFRRRAVPISDIKSLHKTRKYIKKNKDYEERLYIYEILKEEHILQGDPGFVEFVHDKLAEAANEERKTRLKRKKANYVKYLLIAIAIISFFCVFFGKITELNSPTNFPIPPNKVSHYTTTATIDADSAGTISSRGLRTLHLISQNDTIKLWFYDCPNLNKITLSDSLKKKYEWSDSTLWYKRGTDEEKVLFSSLSHNKGVCMKNCDSIYVRSHEYIYSQDFLTRKQDSIIKSEVILKGKKLISFKNNGKTWSIDTINLSTFQNIDTISEYAFKGCRAKCVILPPNLSYISKYAFLNCDLLETIKFCNSCDSIRMEPLSITACSSLSNVVLPPVISTPLNSSRYGIFHDCLSLNSLVYNKEDISFGDTYFLISHCDNLKTIYNLTHTDSIASEKYLQMSSLRKSGTSGGCFVAASSTNDLCYIPSPTQKSIYLRRTFERVGRINVIFDYSPRLLSDIYIVDSVGYYIINGLDSIEKAHITLHVPRNSKLLVDADPDYKDFKDIVETSNLENTFFFIYTSIEGAIHWVISTSNILIEITILLVLVILLSLINKDKKSLNKKITLLLSYVIRCLIVGVVFFIPVYWYIYLNYGENQPMSSSLALFISFILVVIFAKSDWIQDNLVRIIRPILYKLSNHCSIHYKTIGLLLCFIITLMYLCYSYDEYKTETISRIKELNNDGDCLTAAALVNEGLLSTDTSLISNNYRNTPISKISLCNSISEIAELDDEGKYIYIYSSDSTLSKWDIKSEEKVGYYKTSGNITDLKYFPATKQIIAQLSNPHKWLIFDDNLKLSQSINIRNEIDSKWYYNSYKGINQKGDKYILSKDSTITVVNITNKYKDYIIDNEVYDVIWLDSERVAAIKADGCIEFINTSNGHIENTKKVTYSPYGTKLIKTPNLLFLVDGDSLKTINSDEKQSTRSYYAKGRNLIDSKYVFARLQNDSIYVYSKKDLKLLHTIKSYQLNSDLKSVSSNKSGDIISFTYYNQSCFVYLSKKNVKLIQIGDVPAKKVVVNEDRDALVLGCDERISCYNYKKKELVKVNSEHNLYVNNITCLNNSFYYSKEYAIYKYGNKDVEVVRDSFHLPIKEFSSNGKIGISTGNNYYNSDYIYIWGNNFDSIIDSVQGERYQLDDLSVSPLGNYISTNKVSLYYSDSVIVWNIRNKVKSKFYSKVAFANDDRILVIREDTLFFDNKGTLQYIRELPHLRKGRMISNPFSNVLFYYDNDELYLYSINTHGEVQELFYNNYPFIQNGEILTIHTVSPTLYHVITEKEICTFTTDKLQFSKSIHLSKEQREKYQVKWWVYWLNKILQFFTN